MRELLSRPGFLGTHGTLGADISFLMALLFTLLFLLGWRLAKQHDANRHHALVLGAMISMLVYFTFYYLVRSLGALAVESKEGFGGPEWVYDSVFKPLLTVHILAVSVGLVMAVYMIVLGFRAAAKRNGLWGLQRGPLAMSREGFYKILGGTFILFALAAAIRWHSLARLIVYISGFLLVAAVLLVEKGIERWIPDGERRHRTLGTLTMVLYLIALITSTTTYVLLYLIYPPKLS